MTTHILVISGDRQVLHALENSPGTAACELLCAEDGATGLDAAACHQPDLVVLDLDLPDVPGTQVLTGLRSWSKAPVLVLSATSGAADVVAALDAGADGFLAKPLDPGVLGARVRALRRRTEAAPAEEPSVLIGHFSIDLAAKTVTRRADAPSGAPQQMRLTRTEWAILEILARSPGRVVPGGDILERVWGPAGAHGPGHLRFHVARLRKKLEPEPARPRQLLTEPGAGYLFQP